MAEGSICRKCFHSYVCEQFNEHRDSDWDNKKCHFFNDHFVSAADVVEVKHGYWKREDLAGCEPFYLCSVCGKLHDQDYLYCNECGAKMDGKGENG